MATSHCHRGLDWEYSLMKISSVSTLVAGFSSIYLLRIGIAARHSHTIKKLQQEPYANQDKGWQRHNGKEDHNKNNCSYPCPGKQNQVGRQYSGNSATCPKTRYRRV